MAYWRRDSTEPWRSTNDVCDPHERRVRIQMGHMAKADPTWLETPALLRTIAEKLVGAPTDDDREVSEKMSPTDQIGRAMAVVKSKADADEFLDVEAAALAAGLQVPIASDDAVLKRQSREATTRDIELLVKTLAAKWRYIDPKLTREAAVLRVCEELPVLKQFSAPGNPWVRTPKLEEGEPPAIEPSSVRDLAWAQIEKRTDQLWEEQDRLRSREVLMDSFLMSDVGKELYRLYRDPQADLTPDAFAKQYSSADTATLGPAELLRKHLPGA